MTLENKILEFLQTNPSRPSELVDKFEVEYGERRVEDAISNLLDLDLVKFGSNHFLSVLERKQWTA